MKIVYQTDSGDMVLGDDENGLYIRDYSGEARARIQTFIPFRARYPTSISRGLEQPHRSWTLDEEFETAADAFIFSETFPDTIPDTGILEITDGEGVVFFDAIRDVVQIVEREGPTVIIKFNFLVGLARETLNIL